MLLDDLLDLGLEVLGHDTLGDLGEHGLLLGLEVLLEVSVPLDNVLNGDRVKETVDTGVDLTTCVMQRREKARSDGPQSDSETSSQRR